MKKLIILFLILITLTTNARFIAEYDTRDLNQIKYDTIETTAGTPLSYGIKQSILETINQIFPSFGNISFLSDGNITITENPTNSTITLGLSPDANISTLNIKDLNTGDANFVNIGVSENVWAGHFYGDGSQLTGITAGSGKADTTLDSNSTADANWLGTSHAFTADQNFTKVGISGNTYLTNLTATGDSNFTNTKADYYFGGEGHLSYLNITGTAPQLTLSDGTYSVNLATSSSADDIFEVIGTASSSINLRATSSAVTVFKYETGEDHVQAVPAAGYHYRFFEDATSGRTKQLRIYGYKAGDELRYLTLVVGLTAADTATFGGTVSNYQFIGNVEVQDDLNVSGNLNAKGTAYFDGNFSIKRETDNQLFICGIDADGALTCN